MSETAGDLFWRVAATELSAGRAQEGTMMGSRCLRVSGQFAGMVHSRTGEVILKLPKDRVLDLIGEDVAAEFRPNGKLFKEWALLPGPAEDELRALLREAVGFAAQCAERKQRSQA